MFWRYDILGIVEKKYVVKFYREFLKPVCIIFKQCFHFRLLHLFLVVLFQQ